MLVSDLIAMAFELDFYDDSIKALFVNLKCSSNLSRSFRVLTDNGRFDLIYDIIR